MIWKGGALTYGLRLLPASLTLHGVMALMCLRRFILFAFCAVLILPNAPLSRAQDAASAKSFLNSIFKLYQNHGNGTAYSPRYLHSSLLSLIHADLKAAKAASEVPWPLDADIVCDCQEWEGIWVHTIEVKLEKPDRALAIVTFDFEAPGNRSKDDLRKMQYTLVPARGQWRIYDVEDLTRTVESDQPRSLRKQILDDIKDLRRDARK